MPGDKEIKESLGAILEALNDQNKILPAIIFKVDIMWKVLCIVAGFTLLGFLSWLGYMISKGMA